MRADYETRFKSPEANPGDLAKKATGVKLPVDVDSLIRALPAQERSMWLRKVISEAAYRDLVSSSGSDRYKA